MNYVDFNFNINNDSKLNIVSGLVGTGKTINAVAPFINNYQGDIIVFDYFVPSEKFMVNPAIRLRELVKELNINIQGGETDGKNIYTTN